MTLIKKNITFFMVALMAMVLGFSSCNKDDENEAEAETLVGTSWKYTDDMYTDIITFNTATSAVAKWSNNSSTNNLNENVDSLTYTYNPPNIVITSSSEDELTIINGTINGTSMILKSENGDLTYIKQ